MELTVYDEVGDELELIVVILTVICSGDVGEVDLMVGLVISDGAVVVGVGRLVVGVEWDICIYILCE